MGKKYNVFSTEWGDMIAVWSEQGLWELTFPRSDEARAMKDITSLDIVKNNEDERVIELEKALKIYFSGGRCEYEVPIDWTGYTPFQRAVLQYTCHIPYGEVTTYGIVAGAVGSPRAARAVGGALHINRTPVVVPCHRVVGSKGNLTGFGGGLDLKEALLSLEQGNEVAK